LAPDIPLREVAFNLGTLGDVNEPLLAEAIANITGIGRGFNNPVDLISLPIEPLLGPIEQTMFID
jgi:hypothetical protein